MDGTIMMLDDFCQERYIPQALHEAFLNYVIGQSEQLEDLTGYQLQCHWKTFAQGLSDLEKFMLLEAIKKGVIAYGRKLCQLPKGLPARVEVLPGQGFLIYLHKCPVPIVIGWN